MVIRQFLQLTAMTNRVTQHLDAASKRLPITQIYMITGEQFTPSPESSIIWECTQSLQLERAELLSELTASHPSPPSAPPALPLPDEYYLQRFLPRSEEHIRLRYFQKLRGIGMLPDQPRKKLHHLIVFDWDDTLFCTSFMSTILQGQWTRAGPWELQRVEDIDIAACHALETALDLAEVCIITNSAEGWVDFCLQTFMPRTHQLILERKVCTLSARDRHEREFPNNPQRWKTEAFGGLLGHLDNETLVNVVSVGDSVYEMEAAEQASRRFDRRLVKTIRLRQKPRGEQLCKQLKLVSSRLSEVFSSHKSLTIKLQPKQ